MMPSAMVMASMRASAIGPSSSRNPSHHQAVLRRAPFTTTPNPTAFRTITSAIHTAAYWPVPKTAATSIGAIASTGYTQAVSIPTMRPSLIACSTHWRYTAETSFIPLWPP
jgi:hypothetical protein